MRISNLVALGQSLPVLVMGALYYIVFYKQHGAIALVALGCFLIAAVSLVVSRMGASALIPLSQEYVETGSSETARFQPLGHILYYGLDRRGTDGSETGHGHWRGRAG